MAVLEQLGGSSGIAYKDLYSCVCIGSAVMVREVDQGQEEELKDLY